MPQFGPQDTQDAPLDASYLVVSASTVLTNESVLTAGNGIIFTISTGVLTIDVSGLDASDVTTGIFDADLLGGSGGSSTKYLAGNSSWEPYIAYTEVIANRCYAGPSSGLSDLPTFRALVADDIPSLDAGKITTGTLGTARLGSGVADSTTFLRGDSTWQTVSAGSVALDDLTDATITTPSDDQFLRYDGAGWVNETVSLGVSDHGALSGLTDDDHAIYMYAYPGDNTRNVIAPITADVTGLIVKASSGTFSSAHDVLAVQTSAGALVFGIYRSTSGQYFLRLNTNAASGGTLGYLRMDSTNGKTTGYINTSSSAFGDGGSIITNGGTDVAAHGGAISTAGGDFAGGSLNLSGGAAAVGGSIDTSNGGGAILTNSATASYIRLGTSANRVAITTSSPGSAFTATLPNVTGTFCVAATSATATQALFATTTAGSPAYRAIAVGDLSDGIITYAKIQDVSATDKVLGRSTAGSGDVEEIACTAAGRAILDDATAADQRTTLGAAATSHNHNASDINAGTLLHERGGLEADCSAYSGLVKITGGTTSAVPISTWGAQVLNSTVYVAGSDSTNSSNSANADVTGMVFTMAAGGKYLVEGYVLHYAAATTTGLSLGFVDVSSCETAFLWWGCATVSAGQTKGSLVDDSIAAQTGSLSTTVVQLSRFTAYIDNTAGGSGSWQLRFCSEINTSTVTINARSYMTVQTLA